MGRRTKAALSRIWNLIGGSSKKESGPKKRKNDEIDKENEEPIPLKKPKPAPGPSGGPLESIYDNRVEHSSVSYQGSFKCNPIKPTSEPEGYFMQFTFNHDVDVMSIVDSEDSASLRSNLSEDDEITPNVDEINIDCDDTDNQNSKDQCGDREGKQREVPTQCQALEASVRLKELLAPPRKSGVGHIDAGINPFVRTKMEGMQAMLNFYTNSASATYDKWGASACQAAVALGKGRYCARQLCKLTRQFIKDRTLLPINPYGDWNESLLMDEDIASDINLYLQELGKDISAKKIVDYLARPEVMAKHEITKKISERTARHYLNALGFRWKTAKKGQYADGHERDDVVWYRVNKFLPRWKEIQQRMRNWTSENLPEAGPLPGRCVIVWFHDETIFYAHDRRKKGWYHKHATAKPYAKGDGPSLMIAHYVSADFGWLESPDGTQSARRIMRPGKNKDGYFTSDDIIEQANSAIDILTEHYPEYEHIFVYDNASTHLKRPEDALSARRMPKNVPKPGNNWGIEVTKRDENGNPCYLPDGSYQKIKIRMNNGTFADGTPQSLYFEDGDRAGVFKGMANILQERGLGDMTKVRAECKSFKCPPATGPIIDCCCRRILYNQPDFEHVDTILEAACKARGVNVIFLPKFHCELNFIEQCWGYAKRIYRLNPESSREDHLEKNALAALGSIPINTMRRFANRSRRFMDAYDRGLNGCQAAWAAKKYKGHRVLPETIMNDLEKAFTL